MALFSPPVLAPETRPPLGIHGTTYRPLGHQTFVLWHALIITMPWCPSWARRKTFPLRTSGITFLESQKTILPHTHTHSSSLTHKHAGVLQRSVPTKDVLSLASYLRIFVRNKFHLFGCQKNRHALPGSHSKKVNCYSAGVWVKLDRVLIPHLQYLPFQTDRPVCTSILLPSESTVQYLQINK